MHFGQDVIAKADHYTCLQKTIARNCLLLVRRLPQLPKGKPDLVTDIHKLFPKKRPAKRGVLYVDQTALAAVVHTVFH